MDVIDRGLVLIQEKGVLQDSINEILIDVHRIENGPSHVIGLDRENGAVIVKDQNLLLKGRGTGFRRRGKEVHLIQAQIHTKNHRNEIITIN